MKRRHSMVAAAAIATTSVLTLTGCSHSVNGVAEAVSANGSASANTSPVKLDTGKYRTTAQPDFGKAVSAQQGAIIEGQRMAEFVVHPMDIDSNLTKMASMSTYVIKNVDALQVLLPKPIPSSIASDHYVTGFSTSAGDGDTSGHSNVHAVLRFADPASAQQAANDLYNAVLTTDLNTTFGGSPDPGTPPNVGTPDHIAALPDTLVDSHDSYGHYNIDAITPHGSYVFYDWFQGKDGSALQDTKAWADQSTITAVQLQGPKIDAFPATPVGQLANLPIDVDGVLRLTIPPASGQATVNENAVYGPNGFLNFSTTPFQDEQLLNQSGTDRVAFGDTTVFRTRDAQGAKVLLDGFAKENDQSMHSAPAVPGVPGSKCWVSSDSYSSQTTCLIARGRYVANAEGSVASPTDDGDSTTPTTPAPAPGSDITMAHQEAAAQYEILANQN